MDEDLKTIKYKVYKNDELIASNEILVTLMLMVTDTFRLQKSEGYRIEFQDGDNIFHVALEDHEND